jgi:hypothetical protein
MAARIIAEVSHELAVDIHPNIVSHCNYGNNVGLILPTPP